MFLSLFLIKGFFNYFWLIWHQLLRSIAAVEIISQMTDEESHHLLRKILNKKANSYFLLLIVQDFFSSFD